MGTKNGTASRKMDEEAAVVEVEGPGMVELSAEVDRVGRLLDRAKRAAAKASGRVKRRERQLEGARARLENAMREQRANEWIRELAAAGRSPSEIADEVCARSRECARERESPYVLTADAVRMRKAYREVRRGDVASSPENSKSEYRNSK